MPAAVPVTGATSPSVIQSPLTCVGARCAMAGAARAAKTERESGDADHVPQRRLAVERSISSVVVMTLEFIS